MLLEVEFTAHTSTCCGVTYALTRTHISALRRSHGTFYCPGCGRSRHFPGESELEKAHAAQERATQRAKGAERKLASERRSHSATKGHITRHKKRTAAGVCPACDRSFRQLRLHMKRQHPNYIEK